MPSVTITGVGHCMGNHFVTIEAEGGVSVRVHFRTQIETMVFDDTLREALNDLAALDRTKARVLGPELGQRD